MGKNKDLSEDEKHEIEQCLAEGMKTIDISRKLKRDHRTVKRYVSDSQHKRIRSDKGLLRKLTVRQIHVIKSAAVKMPLKSSKQVFETAGVSGVARTSRWRILRSLAAMEKPAGWPPLTESDKEKRLQWAQEYKLTNFQEVLFTYECCATLDGPDGWTSGWLQCQQGGGGVMVWAGILGSEMIGPFRISDGAQMSYEQYMEFLTEHLVPWYQKKNRALQNKIIFMQDNSPFHQTIDSLAAMGIKGGKIMVWPPSSPDLNPIENLWNILKRKVYENGCQYASKKQLWEAIVASSNEIQAETIHGFTSSMELRVVKVISKNGSYINMEIDQEM